MTPFFFSLLAVLLASSIPIFIVLAGAVTTAMWLQGMPLALVVERMFSGIDSFALMAIPFFVLTGNLMGIGGLSKRLIRFADLVVGRMTGGLGITAVTSSMFFGAISGSSPATVVAVGGILYPALKDGGYGRDFSIGLIVASGSLGIIIPPSIVMIVYAAVTGTSVGALFMAGIGAGLVYGLVFMGYAAIHAKRHNVPRSPTPTWPEIRDGFKDASWGLGVPGVILGGIYGGVFTPTEAAAVSVVYAFFVSAFIYREKTIVELLVAVRDSAATTAQVMIILSAAALLAWYLTSTGLAVAMTNAILSISENPIHLFMLINVAVLLAGMFLDGASIMVILAPLFYKVGVLVGIDPVHLGVVLTVNGAIGMFTPPFGLNLFVASSLGKVTYEQAVRGALPFVALAIIALMIVTYVPGISMWLPRLLYAGM
ncbi:TRAP transporter large permease [Mesorhizobium xinjiangense]|uniref:TRAP transporter large permease n=1 Tax=Mesorhizobium xinjiangense TaxID=2678685 RepID=UPI0012EDAF5D|nr:TRAP transporter large permease [Mesorhizobium xinjiangense]